MHQCRFTRSSTGSAGNNLGQRDLLVRSSRSLVVTILSAVLALELALLSYVVRFDANEGWYALYPSMVLHGSVPYRDFFYHRLPLLPYVFTAALALPSSTLFAVRLLCAMCAWIAWWCAAATAEMWCGSRHARTWVLVVGIASLYANSYFVTAQSYAPFAAVTVLAIWCLTREPAPARKAVLAMAGILLGMGMGMRFGPDPLFAAVMTWALVQRWRGQSPSQWAALSGFFLLVLTALFALAAVWDARAFSWDVFVWPVRLPSYLAENGLVAAPADLKGLLVMKAYFIRSAVRNYLPVVLLFAYGIVQCLRSGGMAALPNWIRQVKPVQALAWLIVLADIGFFMIPVSSGMMQFAYVLPLAVACGTALGAFCRSPLKDVRYGKVLRGFAVCVVLSSGATARVLLSCAFRKPGPDVVALAELGRQVENFVPPDKYVVTFDPILVANAHRRVYPGMEFELYGYYPLWDDRRVARFNLTNWSRLRQSLSSQQTGGIIISSRRWSDGAGIGRLLTRYRLSIAQQLRESADLAERVAMPRCLGLGWVDFYRPRFR